jgi:hypothetical protein
LSKDLLSKPNGVAQLPTAKRNNWHNFPNTCSMEKHRPQVEQAINRTTIREQLTQPARRLDATMLITIGQ